MRVALLSTRGARRKHAVIGPEWQLQTSVYAMRKRSDDGPHGAVQSRKGSRNIFSFGEDADLSVCGPGAGTCGRPRFRGANFTRTRVGQPHLSVKTLLGGANKSPHQGIRVSADVKPVSPVST